MSNSLRLALVLSLATTVLPVAAAHADEAEGAVSLSADSADSTSADGEGPFGVDPGMWELGVYGGLFLPAGRHEFFDVENPQAVWQPLKTINPDFGLRAGYFPLQWLGLELEGGLLPSQTKAGDGVLLWAARGHLALLAPTKLFVPFLVAGGGMLGVASKNTLLGSDVDGVFHIGVGAKLFLGRGVALRVDVRDNLDNDSKKTSQHWEALLGLSLVLGRPEAAKPVDTDGDGIVDSSDRCPDVPGPAPEGCPPPPDSDGDGIVDSEDQCPNEPGVASSDPSKHGCPPPPPDSDGDGVADPDDRCPDVPGDGPDGCILDTDGDGIPDSKDQCDEQKETVNGFEDVDGCPDELPDAVSRFTGAIEGISFTVNKAKIRKQSFPTLDAAVKVLTDYDSLRIEISGHTDSTGSAERNQTLSGERAAAVKTYLVDKGIASDRIATRGAGPSEPVADNATREGRAKNRRIEFKLQQ